MIKWLTVKQAVEVLGMSRQAIYSAVREGQLPQSAILRIGRRIRLNPEALRAASEANGATETRSRRTQ